MILSEIIAVLLIQVIASHPIQKRCLVAPCKDETLSPNIRVLLDTVDDETRRPVQQATGYYMANTNYTLSLTPPSPPVTSTASGHHHMPPAPYGTPPPQPILPPSSSPSAIVRSPIFLRAEPASAPLVASVYRNPSGAVRPSSQLQPPFVVVKLKKVSSPPPIEIITTPRSEATLVPTTTVAPSTMTVTSSTTIPSFIPPLSSLADQSTTTVAELAARPVSDAAAESSSPIMMSEEELRKRVAAMLNKNQLMCTMFGICDGVNQQESPAASKTFYNPTEKHLEFIPRIVTAPTTPSQFQFVFEFASTIAPTLRKLNQQLPLFSAQYAANPPQIMPHPKSLNPNKLSLSSLLSSIVASPLAAHCPSCVQLLLNLCSTENRSSKDCVVTPTPRSPPPPTQFPIPMRAQKTFSFAFPNPITGQRIEAAAVVPTTTTLRPWQTTYAPSSSSTIDPFAPLNDDDEMQYDFDFEKRPVAEIQYDGGGGYGLVGERRGVLPWSVNRAG